MSSKLLLSVQDALVSFGDKALFEGLSFNIHEGRKICLVGKNGAGKTTLMNIITGARELDDGKRWLLEGSVIGYLQQDIVPVPGQTVFDFIFEIFKSKEERDTHQYKIEMVIDPLDLKITDRMDTLSGGQLRRAALARALVEEPDILLLDEPTNHLDLDIIEWLEEYLKSYRGAVVCVSHDKKFLETVSDSVFWLDRGRMRVCPRGFSYFDEWSTMLLEQEERELRNREKILSQEVEWASRGVKGRRKRNIRRLELMKAEREKLRQDKNAFNRMMAKIDMPDAVTGELSSRVVAEFKSVHKSFEDTVILNKFNIRLMRGDRIGILGRNGSGKTTFLRLLTGELKADSGTVKLKKDVEFSYFDQKRRDLDYDKSLWQTLCPTGGDHLDVRGKSRHVVGYLKDFLFDPSIVHQKVGTLSGGQKNRLMLAKVLANPKNVLILDEPTNDLDMDTLDMLEEVLIGYDGTLVIVSHDRDFLDQTVSKILAFEGDGKIEGYIGGYTDYLEAKRERARAQKFLAVKAETIKKISVDKTESVPAKPAVKLSYKLQYELDNLPQQIEALEAEIGALEDILNDPDFYTRDPGGFQNATRQLVLRREKLEAAETRWLELDALRASGVE